MRYKYKMVDDWGIRSTYESLMELLNKADAEGWELVSTTIDRYDTTRFYLRKPIIQSVTFDRIET